ncbi:alcohol oxidase-like protein [Xylaria bambusicola]|uniref:alcohol oxidase-like protein n=1 Tax=Xylaria bambusicola TaxID=326684 RepID=UPI002007CEA4|nr:alcohol oxidase-like protein [Xylaria bambusicola]KAI0503175.1 alcohol oxidase-like protein [Xylaria bambusicola]
MPIYTQLPKQLDTVDVVIAGGGTAGCIVASRLADADPNLSILVIEQGSDNNGDPSVTFPAMYPIHLSPESPRMQFLKGNKSIALANRELIVPAAKSLGGGSSVNMLMYSRIQQADAESWQSPGWSQDEMLRLMKKLETYHGPGRKEQHGSDGPIQVSLGTYSSPRLSEAFVAASARMGWKELQDLGDLETNNGIQRALRYISPDGKRQDTAHCYLHPRLQDGKHPNLHVLVESRVVKIIFDETKRATGVVYAPMQSAELRRIKATKMVVVSSGACGTPLLLERSGVGDPIILKHSGIELVAQVPGVGATYDDHYVCSYPYHSSLDIRETLDGFLNGNFDIPDMMQRNDEILGWNGFEITGKLRPNPSDVVTLGPDFEVEWNRTFANIFNKPMIGLTLVAGNAADPFTAPVGQYFSNSVFNLYPLSTGHIHVTGPNLDDPLDFDPAIFTDKAGVDIKKCIWAYKAQREISRRMSVYRGEVATLHPEFGKDSKAACVKLHGPPATDIEDIEYTAEDDAAIERWLRNHISTTWHSAGTCKMLPLDKNGVVDANLSVHNVTALKIADASIIPHNVGAHTNNITMVIGEKAAEILIEELGLSQ